MASSVQSATPQPHWHQLFLALLPAIQRCAERAFGSLRGDARQEALQETIANALVAFVRLVELGQLDRVFPSALARFAIRQVRLGRQVGGRLNSQEPLSRYAQRRNHFTVESLDDIDDEQQGEWVEAVVQDTQTPVPDQVCFRIDFPEWLASHSARRRQIAEALAVGTSTDEAAKAFQISRARISQLRREFYESWQTFQGTDLGLSGVACGMA